MDRRGLLLASIFLAIAGAGAAAALPLPGFWSEALVAACLAAAFLLAYGAAIERLLRLVYARVLVVMVPVVLLAAAFILFAVLPADLPDPGTRAGAIAGTMVAAGWIVTFVSQELRIERTRRETTRDVLNALQAEVWNLCEKLDRLDLEKARRDTLRLIREAAPGQPYHPFTTSESEPVAFEAMGDGIKLIEAETLNWVIRFYSTLSELRSFTADCQREDFRALPAGRRARAHDALGALRESTLILGFKALIEINRALGVPNPRAFPRSGRNPEIYALASALDDDKPPADAAPPGPQ